MRRTLLSRVLGCGRGWRGLSPQSSSCVSVAHLIFSRCRPLSQDKKPVVQPEWLEKSIKKGKRQPYSRYQALYAKQDEVASDTESSGDHADDSADEEEVTTSTQADLSATAKFTCQRESPLVCLNQELVEQIDVIRRARELDMNWQSALSYGRAIAVGSLRKPRMQYTNLNSR